MPYTLKSIRLKTSKNMNQNNTKQALLEQLYAPYKNCTQCPLGSLGRTNVVFGQGNPDSKLIIIGEAPGREEDFTGAPFVGRSGKLLSKALAQCGIHRDDIFITNVVKCRPPDNRTPKPSESSTCMDLLLFNQIKIINPLVLCTLGTTATQGLLGPETKFSAVRGSVQRFQSIAVVPTYHPAYILRNATKFQTFVDDLMIAVMLISNKKNQ
jgi:uracil-DNA glycosylase family 4